MLFKLKFILMDHTFLKLLLIINILGTIYGYIWYEYQLVRTPLHFIPFVPDSPTASLFFVIVLFGLLMGKNFGLFEALAMLTLFKYGIWAVVMNILTFLELGEATPAGIMLIVSHGAMAIQGLLYAPYYKIKWFHVVIAAVWTLHNDIIDYVYGMMPIYGSLDQYISHIGYFTFWLSLVSIWLVYKYGMMYRTKTTP